MTYVQCYYNIERVGLEVDEEVIVWSAARLAVLTDICLSIAVEPVDQVSFSWRIGNY